MDEEISFHCSKCGECCRHIDQIPQLKMYDKGNGICVNLRGNECSIYDTRPEICRVDVMYELYYSHVFSRQEFYMINEGVCKVLQNNL